ncbi:YadA-like family protein [Brevundimonas faecalis]
MAIGASRLMSSGRVTLRGSASFSRGGGSGGGVGIAFNF